MQLLERAQRGLMAFRQEHSGALYLLTTLFVMGVIFGALAVRSLDPGDKAELVSYLGNTALTLQHPPQGIGAAVLRQSLVGDAKLLLLFWVLGISLVGVLGVMLVTFLRGLVTGFVVAFLAAEMGVPGILLALVGHLPQSLIEVPALILAGAASVAFSTQVIRSWRERRRVPNFYPALGSYTSILLLLGLVLALSAVVEGYLSPGLVRLAASMIHPA
ncbi:MAG: stage II sporulation protein M [Mycobacterium leprae]